MRKKQRKFRIFSVPFASFSIPSLEIASLSGYLKKQNFDVKVHYPGYEYGYFLGWPDYKYLRDTECGRIIFSELLFGIKIENESDLDEKRKEILKRQTQTFSKNYISKLNLSKNTVAIFHNYHVQLLPALYFAKLLKEICGCDIWFTGFHCKGKLGANLKEIFPFISETIGSDLEENVLAKIEKKDSLPNRDLDFLPTPDFDDFYELSQKIKEDIPAFRKNNIGYQVEYSRGCKWNRCSFCTLNCHSNDFRERSTKLLIDDYHKMAQKYHTTLIYPEHFVMGDGWEKWLLDVSKFHKNTSNTMNLNFKVSDLLTESSFKVLKEAKANILVGTESFSPKYLKRLNKGQRVIENIQVLKFARRWNVPCFHNFMYGLPYENKEMYLESQKNIEYIYHLQPPFDMEAFRLTYGSEIYNNFRNYNIKKIFMKTSNQYLFPKKIRDSYVAFFYDFETENDHMVDSKKWHDLIEKWRRYYYKSEYSSNPVIEAALVMSKYENVTQIIDRRYDTQITYNLTMLEWEVYQYLDEIKDIEEVKCHFKNLEALSSILEDFLKKKLIFMEENSIVALAV